MLCAGRIRLPTQQAYCAAAAKTGARPAAAAAAWPQRLGLLQERSRSQQQRRGFGRANLDMDKGKRDGKRASEISKLCNEV